MDIDTDKTLDQVISMCSENSIRLTKQRKRVLDVLLSANQALSAYELAKIYNKRFNQRIIATSVYRILEFFIELRIAYRLDTINKFIARQNENTSSSDVPVFMICVHCNDVNELSLPSAMVENMHRAAKSPKFRVIESKLELKAICKSCECAGYELEAEKVLEKLA